MYLVNVYKSHDSVKWWRLLKFSFC